MGQRQLSSPASASKRTVAHSAECAAKVGEYDINIVLIEAQYSLFDSSFRSIVFAEYLYDTSRRFDGSEYKDTYVLGVRWSFQI